MKHVIMLALLLSMLQACEGVSPEVTELQNQCIEQHDLIMPRMGELNECAQQLKKKLKAMEADTTLPDSSIQAEIYGALHQLDSADEAMMNWMAEYNPTYAEEKGKDSSLIYYQAEYKAITRIGELMDESIRNGNEILEKLP